MASSAPSENGKQYTFVELLGKGGYSSVSKVKDNDGNVYARKTINTYETPEAIKNEIAIMKRLRHKHIIHVVDQIIANHSVSIILSPVADCDLAHYLAVLDETEGESERVQLVDRMGCWSVCLLATLDFLHDLKIKHRDLKPRNILVKDNRVLIADFGIAHNLVDETTTGSRGTPDRFSSVYCAPETFDGRRGRASDVFSLGCVFLEMLTVMSEPAHSLRQLHDMKDQINPSRAYCKAEKSILFWLGKRHAVKNFFSFMSCRTLLQRCFLMLDPDPKQRITARQCLVHVANPAHEMERRIASCADCIMSSKTEDHLPSFAKFYWEFSDYRENRLLILQLGQGSKLRVPTSWEEAKTMWLTDYIWWPESIAAPRNGNVDWTEEEVDRMLNELQREAQRIRGI